MLFIIFGFSKRRYCLGGTFFDVSQILLLELLKRLLQIKPVSPFSTYAEGSIDFHGKGILSVNTENLPTDDDILDAEPKIKPRPRLNFSVLIECTSPYFHI